MSPVGFEPTIPVFERAKAVHALDRAATVIGEDDEYAGEKCNENDINGNITMTKMKVMK
jgi:hypothetical protein